MFLEFWHTRVGVLKICIFNRVCCTLIFMIFKGQYVTHILYNSLFMFEIMVIDTGVHYLDQSINENIIILVWNYIWILI